MKGKTLKIETIDNSGNLELSTDDEIELKPTKNKVIAQPQPIKQSITEPEIKPKRKINLTEEERERRRQSMIETRAKKQAQVERKKQLEQEFLEAQEEVVKQNIIKQAEKLKKQKEKETYKKYLEEINNKQKVKASKKKIIYESETEEEDEESEEEVVIVKKKKGTLQGDLIEDPDYMIAHNLKIDTLFYITNQIMKPACQFLELIIERPEDLFHHYIQREITKRDGKKNILSYDIFEDSSTEIDDLVSSS